MKRALCLVVAAFFTIVVPGKEAKADKTRPAAPPLLNIHEGAHWIWYAPKDLYDKHRQDFERFYPYADQAFDYLSDSWGLKPKGGPFVLYVNPKTGGAFATGDVAEVHAVTGKASPGIGVAYDAFVNEANGVAGYWGYALITHEMVNMFTGGAVSGGWPVDWWANHRSPFPLMTAVQVETALKPEVAVIHARQINDPLVKMFAALKDQYGWQMFRRAFREASADGINWDSIGQNPSALRTNYVCAYLQFRCAGGFDAAAERGRTQLRRGGRGQHCRCAQQMAWLAGEFRGAQIAACRLFARRLPGQLETPLTPPLFHQIGDKHLVPAAPFGPRPACGLLSYAAPVLAARRQGRLTGQSADECTRLLVHPHPLLLALRLGLPDDLLAVGVGGQLDFPCRHLAGAAVRRL